jgi:DNA-binding beta-propeller fold protein YncE
MHVSDRRPRESDASAPSADALIEEARQRQRRRRRWIAGIMLLAAAIGGATGAVLSMGTGTPPAVTAAGLIARPLPVTLADRGATTAFVSDAAGLVPIDLKTGKLQQVIRIAGLDATANVVGSPNGRTAYVVSLPTPSEPGVDETGPLLIPVNLVTHHLGAPIPFRASAYSAGTGQFRTVSFDITALAITPDGTMVLVADAADHAVIPVDVATRTVERPIVLPAERTVGSLIAGNSPISNYPPVQPADLGGLAVDPNGRTAYVTDGYVVVPIDLVTHHALAPITGFEAPTQIAIDPSGQYAYVTSAYCWSSDTTGKCVATPAHPVTEPNCCIQLYAAGNQVSVVNLSTDQITKEVAVGTSAMPTGVAVSPDGTKVYVTYGLYGNHGNDITVIDARTNTIERQLHDALPANRGDGATYIAISPEGNEAFVTGFTVITPGPAGPVTFRGAVLVNLATGRPATAVRFGAPVTYGESTGPVLFGQ